MDSYRSSRAASKQVGKLSVRIGPPKQSRRFIFLKLFSLQALHLFHSSKPAISLPSCRFLFQTPMSCDQATLADSIASSLWFSEDPSHLCIFIHETQMDNRFHDRTYFSINNCYPCVACITYGKNPAKTPWPLLQRSRRQRSTGRPSSFLYVAR